MYVNFRNSIIILFINKIILKRWTAHTMKQMQANPLNDLIIKAKTYQLWIQRLCVFLI